MKKFKKYLIFLLIGVSITLLTGIFRIPHLFGYVTCAESGGFPIGFYPYQLPNQIYCMALPSYSEIVFGFIVDVIFWFLILYLVDLFLPKLKKFISSSKFFF